MYVTDFNFPQNLLDAAYKNTWDEISQENEHNWY